MKKLLSLLLSLILVLGLCGTTAFAAGNGKITAANASGKQGDTISVDIGIGSNPGLITFKVSVAYDSDLELKGVSDSGRLKGFTTPSPTLSSPYTLRWADSLATQNNAATGKIITLTFKIKDTATPGNKSVTVSFVESRDASGGKNTFTDATATVSVSCKSHRFGDCSKLNDAQHQRTCSACGYVEKAGHTWNGGTVVKAATCKDTGTKEYTCTACGAKKQETVAKTDHHTWGGWNVTKQPTCTASGTTTRTCSVCGKTENQTVNATGHSMGSWTQTKAPTCTEKGEEKRSCEKCSHFETRAVNALGHNFSNPTVTKEPTCTETGVESGKCSRCGQTTTNTIKAKGHKFGAWADAKAATCTAGGTQERKCTVCDAAESRDTKALGHDFENPTIVKEATISSTGLKEGKCKRCGETTKEIIPCSFKDETTGVQFEASEGAFAAGTELKVEEITGDNPTFASAENVLKDACGEFRLYTVAATANNAAVQPTGAVTVTLPVPDGFGKDVAVFCIASDGTYTKAESALSADGKTVSVSVTALGSFAVGKQGTQTENGDNNTDVNGNVDTPDDGTAPQKSGTVIYIILAVAALLVIGGVVAWIVIKKKKTA